jgi:TPR repeat protein
MMVALILTGLAAMAQAAAAPAPAAAPNLAAICEALDRRRDPSAQDIHNLGTCLFRGEGLAQDLPRARSLYAQAAARGIIQADCALGNMMIAGRGGPTDVAGGLARCRRAAEAGDAQAQTDLGGYLLMGRVMPKDAVEARRWLTSAARQRQANAAMLLGQIYWNGDGVAKDNREAARWWLVAHEGGRPDAANLLAREALVRAMRGTTRPEDTDPATLAEALRWFAIAAQSDPAEAMRQEASRMAALLRQLQSTRTR